MSFQSTIVNDGTNYIVPTKPYYLRAVRDAIDEISFVTQDFQLLPPYFNNLEDQLSGRQRVTMYGQFDAPTDKNIIKKINGKNGFFLKKTIKEADIDLIWWNEVTNHYLFWGTTKGRVIDAMNRIRSRIVKYVVHLNPAKNIASQHDRSPSPSPASYNAPASFNWQPTSKAAVIDNSRYLMNMIMDGGNDDDLLSTPPPASCYFKPNSSSTPPEQKIFRSVGYRWGDDEDEDDNNVFVERNPLNFSLCLKATPSPVPLAASPPPIIAPSRSRLQSMLNRPPPLKLPVRQPSFSTPPPPPSSGLCFLPATPPPTVRRFLSSPGGPISYYGQDVCRSYSKSSCDSCGAYSPKDYSP